ncbi:hypothetical protein JB92DRAFT_3143908 [Gautieria morchelliformis]|nr:hypothetical protein JB92DRAFT_3143908 [Gautieria morchelliformis]
MGPLMRSLRPGPYLIVWSVHGSALCLKGHMACGDGDNPTTRLLMATSGSSFSSLLERMQAMIKVRPKFQANLQEEVEQWVVDAEGIQAELQAALRVEAVIDPKFERPLDVDNLVKEVKEAKEWLRSLTFTVDPAFLDIKLNLVSCPTGLRRPLKDGCGTAPCTAVHTPLARQRLPPSPGPLPVAPFPTPSSMPSVIDTVRMMSEVIGEGALTRAQRQTRLDSRLLNQTQAPLRLSILDRVLTRAPAALKAAARPFMSFSERGRATEPEKAWFGSSTSALLAPSWDNAEGNSAGEGVGSGKGENQASNAPAPWTVNMLVTPVL